MPSLRLIIAISFTSPIFTARKVFSSSLTISAVSVDDTGTISSRICEYRAAAKVKHSGLAPPSTFGVFLVLYTWLPGSTRSGENAMNTVRPEHRALLRQLGNHTSVVVPG